MLYVAIALALLVGLTLGILGGGGSLLMVPILRYVLGMETHAAIALSLLVVGTTSLAAVVPHARKGRVRFRTGLLFGLAGMAGAYPAGRLAHLLPGHALLIGFALLMLVSASALLRRKEPRGTAERCSGELPLSKALAQGTCVGALAGLVGAGGGFLVVPTLVLLAKLPIELAVGTSLLVIAMQSLAAFLGVVRATPVQWTFALAVSASAVLGSVAGAALVSRLRPAALRVGFGWFAAAMACVILARELPPLLGA